MEHYLDTKLSIILEKIIYMKIEQWNRNKWNLRLKHCSKNSLRTGCYGCSGTLNKKVLRKFGRDSNFKSRRMEANF